jgi:hypothetical protein
MTATHEYRLVVDDQFKVSVYSAPKVRAYLYEEHMNLDGNKGTLKKAYVLRNAHREDLVQIVPARRFPLPAFDLLEGGKKVGELLCLTLLRTQYRFAFQDGTSWEIHMPLFSIQCRVLANKTVKAWVRIFRQNEWGLAYLDGEAPVRFLACVSALVLARWRST